VVDLKVVVAKVATNLMLFLYVWMTKNQCKYQWALNNYYEAIDKVSDFSSAEQ
jgi:hypothetical protein